MMAAKNSVHLYPILAVLLLVPAKAQPGAAPVENHAYIVEPERTELVVRLFKAGVGAAFAHDHVVRATRFEGGVVFDPDEPASASIRLEADARSLEADDPTLREKYGLDKSMSDKQRRKVQAAMESAKQLDPESFPTISFQSTKIEPQEGKDSYLVSGDFTLHGTTRSITFPATAEVRDGSFHGRAELAILQSDYGIKPYSAALGTVRNQDEVVLILEVVAVPAADRADSQPPAGR